MKKKQITMEDFLTSLEGDEKQLGALLAMPDKEFNTLSPYFLEGFETNLQNPNDKKKILDTLLEEGYTAKDLQFNYQEIFKQINTQFSNLSSTKKDFLKQFFFIMTNAFDIAGEGANDIPIPIELCHPNAKIPTYANSGDSGMDIYAIEDTVIGPGETKLVKTGLKVAIPKGYELQVRPKSGLSLKTNLRVANTPGTIDSGYRSEIGVIVENIQPSCVDIDYEFGAKGEVVLDSILHGQDYIIEKGQKFAQLVLQKVPKAFFYEVETVQNIGEDRGGGFGSTGLK